MKRNWTKALCLLLSAVMLMTMVVPSVLAADQGEDVTVIFEDDFESYPVDAMPKIQAKGWSAASINRIARAYVTEDDGNRILKAYHGDIEADPTSRTPRIDKLIPLAGLTNLKIEYDVKWSGGNSSVKVGFVKSSTNESLGTITTLHQFTKWAHIRIDADLKKGSATIYVDGDKKEVASFEVPTEEAFLVRFNFKAAADGSWVAIDNVRMTTTDKDVGGMIDFDGTTVNWKKVKLPESEKTGLMDVMRKTHPRLYVTNWQDILDKVATNENCKAWYEATLRSADTTMASEPTKYFRNVRDNLNDCSSLFRNAVIPLAAAYCLTKDVRYKDRLYQELEYVGNWPDWGADAYLCTAHIILGFAVSYDWLYNDWTPEERKNIAGWMMDMGMAEAVRAYEMYNTTVKINTTTSNWNNVCNGSNLIGAIALADEYPDMADYVFRKAANALPHCFDEISADGSYAEPINYWDYGIRYQVKAMAALDTCIQPGTKLPECLDFKDVPGISNTGDFPIYYNGPTAGFNYGDGEDKLIVSSIMYWLANKYHKPQYTWYNLYMQQNNSRVSTASGKEATWSLLWYDPNNSAMPEGGFRLDKFYSSTEKFGTNGISMRSSWEDKNALFVAMHAGDQTAAHSSLDAGGFILDWNNKRWVHMYGRNPAGTKSTYSWPNFHTKGVTGGHYSYYHCRGEANNTIIANPKQDEADMNIKYFADLMKSESGVNTAYGIINMTQTNLDYEDAKRGVMMTGNREIIVLQDEIKAKKPSEFYWFTNTNADITIAEDGKSALWEMGGDRMLVRITQGPADAVFGVMPTQPLPTSPNPKEQVTVDEYKMFLHMNGVSDLKLTVEFVPLKEGEGIPQPLPVKPIAAWSVDKDGEKLTSQKLGDIVALKLDNPNAYAKGAKTYVDTENLDIKPIEQNGRTLVPVRFISEKFGANVGWDDSTQTVTVKTKANVIALQLGSDIMTVNGEPTTLDVPAQEIGGRTLIPLRALVEALGKEVFWDDRGLILISDNPLNYDAAMLDKVIALLDIRVQYGDKELKFFDPEVHAYNIQLEKDETAPEIRALSDAKADVTQGNPATAKIDGKIYTFYFVKNPFEGVMGTGSDGVLKTLVLKPKNVAKVDYQTYLSVADVASSIDFNEKYPKTGTIDGIISAETENRWSADGAGNWISYDLGSVQNLHSIAIAGYNATTRAYTFEIALSNDSENWEVALPNANTSSKSDHDVFNLGDKQARFIKITGLKASNSTWMGINEVRIYDSAKMEEDDQNIWRSFFYKDAIAGKAGTTAQLDIIGVSKSGEEMSVNIRDITLTSGNPEIATVDANGNVQLLKAGSTVIRAEIVDHGMRKMGSVEVTVE